ncbi:MAG: hypothetical protein U0L20_03365 [Ruminococcus sp.]|nr:hypothetical protein [Ruminococcus sp.]
MNFLNLFDFVNLYGFLIIISILVPNVVYAKSVDYKSKLRLVENRSMLYIEKIGKYFSLFLMAFNLGVLEKGFTTPVMFKFWLVTMAVLVAVYTILWFVYFRFKNVLTAYSLTIIAAVIFMLSGLLQVKTLLLTFGLVYFIGGLYVTSKYTAN